MYGNSELVPTPGPLPPPRVDTRLRQIAVVDPTQGSLPPLDLEFRGYTRDSREDKSAVEGGDGGSRTTGVFQRATEAVLEWEQGGTREGAEAALAATARMIAGVPLSVDAWHLRGLALHLLGRWVTWIPRFG